MGTLIGAIGLALATAWMLQFRIRARFQNYNQGADKVAKQLGDNTTSDARETSVEIWDAYPLTIPMIKDLAESMGYKYVEDSHSRKSAAKVLVFKPPKPKPRRLNL